jgi:hypothetical protein
MLTQVSFNENPENAARNPEALRLVRFGPEVEVSTPAHTLCFDDNGEQQVACIRYSRKDFAENRACML